MGFILILLATVQGVTAFNDQDVLGGMIDSQETAVEEIRERQCIHPQSDQCRALDDLELALKEARGLLEDSVVSGNTDKRLRDVERILAEVRNELEDAHALSPSSI